MTATVIDFTDLLLAALLAGAVSGVSLMMQPGGLDAATYVIQQQNGIRTLNNVMPALGALTILMTLAAAFLARDDRARLILLIAAAVCFLAAGLITRFCNQPINAIVMTWAANSPPATWTQLRDEWWRWHLIRLVFSLIALSLTIAATAARLSTHPINARPVRLRGISCYSSLSWLRLSTPSFVRSRRPGGGRFPHAGTRLLAAGGHIKCGINGVGTRKVTIGKPE